MSDALSLQLAAAINSSDVAGVRAAVLAGADIEQGLPAKAANDRHSIFTMGATLATIGMIDFVGGFGSNGMLAALMANGDGPDKKWTRLPRWFPVIGNQSSSEATILDALLAQADSEPEWLPPLLRMSPGTRAELVDELLSRLDLSSPSVQKSLFSSVVDRLRMMVESQQPIHGNYVVVDALLKTAIAIGNMPAQVANDLRSLAWNIEKGERLPLMHVLSLHRKEDEFHAAVKILVAAGFDVDQRCERGRTPLMQAASMDSVPVCLALIELGADIKAKDRSKATPYMHSRNASYTRAMFSSMRTRLSMQKVIDADNAKRGKAAP